MSRDTEGLKRRIIEALKTNPLISPACRKAGVAKSSFYRWMKEDKAFGRATRQSQMMGRAIICDAAESRLLNILNSGSDEMAFKVAKYLLNSFHPIYRSEHKGIQYQKAAPREEIEKEKNIRKEGDEMLVKLLEIVKKYALESGKENNRKDIINPLQGAIDDINKFRNSLTEKDKKEDDWRDKLKDLI